MGEKCLREGREEYLEECFGYWAKGREVHCRRWAKHELSLLNDWATDEGDSHDIQEQRIWTVETYQECQDSLLVIQPPRVATSTYDSNYVPKKVTEEKKLLHFQRINFR